MKRLHIVRLALCAVWLSPIPAFAQTTSGAGEARLTDDLSVVQHALNENSHVRYTPPNGHAFQDDLSAIRSDVPACRVFYTLSLSEDGEVLAEVDETLSFRDVSSVMLSVEGYDASTPNHAPVFVVEVSENHPGTLGLHFANKDTATQVYRAVMGAAKLCRASGTKG